MIRIGAQLSQARGYETIIAEAGHAGLRSLQLFSRNPVGGQSRDLPAPGSLKPHLRSAGIDTVFVHAPYFVNPAATDEAMLERARVALKAEMRRAKRLSADYVVLHPGHWQKAHDPNAALYAFTGTVVTMLTAPGRVLIENSAGQGRELGANWGELGRIFRDLGKSQRVGFMLDTAHVMAFGHVLQTSDDAERLWQEIQDHIGLDRLRGIHLNDSLYPVGSKKDRHAHLLTGSLGRDALVAILRWAAAHDVPVILETPGRDLAARDPDMALIRGLI